MRWVVVKEQAGRGKVEVKISSLTRNKDDCCRYVPCLPHFGGARLTQYSGVYANRWTDGGSYSFHLRSSGSNPTNYTTVTTEACLATEFLL